MITDSLQFRQSDPFRKYVKKDKNILDTSKMFFGKFLFKAELGVNGAYWINSLLLSKKRCHRKYRDNKFEFLTWIEERKRWATESEIKWSWGGNRTDTDATLDGELMYSYYEAVKPSLGAIKIRIEGNRFHIFTKTAQEMIDILDRLPHCEDFLKTITRPANAAAAALLENNIILVENPKYQYKVLIKEGKYDRVVREQLLKYLDNFPTDVHLPAGLRYKLESQTYDYLENYYYINDISILTFLAMISPKFVNKIYKLEPMPAK